MALVDPQGVGRRNFLTFLDRLRGMDKEVRDVLRDTKRAVGREIRSIPGNSLSESVRRGQYMQVRDDISRHISTGWRDIGNVIEGNVGRTTSVITEGAQALLDVLGDRLPVELLQGMQAAAETSAQRVAARIATRIDLSPRVYRNAALSSGRVDAIINQAIAQNMSAKELATRVSKYISPDAPGGMSYSAFRLGRTELNNAYHAASSAIYQDQPWVENSKWLLSGSHPKPDVCNELAENDNFGLGGGTYPTSAIPAKPHPNCLCYTVPVTPSRKAFVDKLLGGGYNDWLEENGLEPL